MGSFSRLNFTPQSNFYEITQVRIADLNRDGYQDIFAILGHGSSSGLNGRLLYYENYGGFGFLLDDRDSGALLNMPNQGYYSMLTNPVFVQPAAMVLADFQGDQNEEVVLNLAMLPGLQHLYHPIFKNLNVDRPRESTRFEMTGTGTTGPGGVIPGIGIAGISYVGNPNFWLTLRGAAGGIPAVAYFAPFAMPFHWGGNEVRMSLFPSHGDHSQGVLTSGIGQGNGMASVQIPIPNHPWLLGQDLWFQWVMPGRDQTRNIDVTHTDAIHVRVGRKK